MGTNYYHRTNICEKCNRYKEKHIGKSSGGWQFSFQGYREHNIPKIASFRDWKRELQADGKIFDEYGEEMSFEDFVKMVENKQYDKFNSEANMNHYDYCVKSGYNVSNDWKDKEEYSFTSADFS